MLRISDLSRLFGVMLVSAALFSADASAQTSTRWTAPSGQWSIDFVSRGWTFASPVPPELQRYALIMIPQEAPPDNEVRMCAVSEQALEITDSDVQRVRSTAARLDAATAAGMYAPHSQTVTGMSVTEINGVSVADISTRSTRNGMLHLHRIFYLPVDGRVTFVDIDCLWTASLDSAKVAEMPAVLGTISINAASETP